MDLEKLTTEQLVQLYETLNEYLIFLDGSKIQVNLEENEENNG